MSQFTRGARGDRPSGGSSGQVGAGFQRTAPTDGLGVAQQPGPLGSGVPIGTEGGQFGSPVPIIDQNGAVWTGPPVSMQFALPTAYYATVLPGHNLVADWATPLFDLRPELRSRAGYSGDTASVSAGYPRGSTDSLHIEISNLALFSGGSWGFYQWFFTEFGAAENPSRAQDYNMPGNISAAVWGMNLSTGVVILRFLPIGPLRYWGVRLMCARINGSAVVAPANPLIAAAAH